MGYVHIYTMRRSKAESGSLKTTCSRHNTHNPTTYVYKCLAGPELGSTILYIYNVHTTVTVGHIVGYSLFTYDCLHIPSVCMYNVYVHTYIQ